MEEIITELKEVLKAWERYPDRLGAWLSLFLRADENGMVSVSVRDLEREFDWGQTKVQKFFEDAQRIGALIEMGKGPRGVRIWKVLGADKAAEALKKASVPDEVAMPAYSPIFEDAWKMYPRKRGHSKRKAWSAWNKQLAKGKTEQYLFEKVVELRGYYERKGTKEEFMKHMSTFLSPREEYVDEDNGGDEGGDEELSAEDLSRNMK